MRTGRRSAALAARAPALLVAALLVAGCSERAPDPPRAPKRLVVGTTVEPDTLNPLFTSSAGAAEVIRLVSRDLTLFDPSWRLRPDLAVEVPTLQGGGVKLAEDGRMIVTWRIRDDAFWEDGVPVTADDFVFAWTLARDERQGVLERDVAARTSLRAAGEDRKLLEVTWSAPSPTYAEPGLHPALPAHVLRPVLEDGQGGRALLSSHPSGRSPLSMGPFRVVSWRMGQEVVLARNERHRPRARLDELVVRFAPSTTSLASMLKAGDIDVVLATGGLSPSEAEAIVREAGGAFALSQATSATWAHLDLRMDDPWLQDARVRRALAHAFDRRRAVEGVFGGAVVLAESFLPPVHPLFLRGAQAPAHDPARAERLLEEAGWKRPAPGQVRVNAKGERLRLVVSSASGQKEAERLLLLLQSDLREVGVELALDLKPFPVFFADDVKKRRFKHLAFYAWSMGPTSDGETLWRKDRIPSEENGFQGKNIPGWKNDEVTAALARANATLDEAERARLVARVQQLFLEELPALPLYFKASVAVRRVGVSGIAPTGTQTPTTWNAAEWDVAPAR